jgi:hypothetical protein
MIFVFPNDDALVFSLTGAIVPSKVSLSPARTGRDAAGLTWIDADVPADVAADLRRIGVQTVDESPPFGREVAHWLETVPLRRDPAPPVLTDQTPVLFELSDPAGLIPLVGEMLRLGNDRQGFRFVAGPALLRVIGPPYYSLLRAIDRNGSDSPRAYLEQTPRVWVEVGWTHPLVEQLRPPTGHLLLLRPPHQWTTVADLPFRDVYDVLDVQFPGQSVAWSDAPAEKLNVPLRLAAGAAGEAAELWILHGDAVEQMDSLARDADDRLLARLVFAVAEQDGQRIAVLRARPHKAGPPALVLENVLACRPYLRLPNLYLPVGTRLRPPLRRDAVRRVLADDAEQVVWLMPVEGDSFVPQSLPETAFRPLGDWVEYVLDRDAAALSAWAGVARFEFGTFVGRDDRAVRRPTAPRERKPTGAAAAVAEAARSKFAAAKPKAAEASPAPVAEPLKLATRATPSEMQVHLASAEEQFLAVDGPLDDSRRLALWPELARLNGLLGHGADAGLAWANALWEPADPPPTWAWGWVEAERALPKPELTSADLDRLLANPTPLAAELRPLAAALVWATRQKPVPPELSRRLPEVQRYLERHDYLLPVRAAWLAWHGLAAGDVLTLARTRDRLLERLLAEGLNVERDLPGFLRFAGGREGDRLRTVRSRAERLRQLVHEWSGFKSGDGLQQTAAYIDLLFAFGFARLGEAGAARGLAAQAGALLEASGNEAHTFLLEAFRYRIDQAIAGKPHSGPLPTEQLEYLEQMRRDIEALPKDDLTGRLPPYVIERMKEQSRVLDPQEEIDPYRAKKSEQDIYVRELVKLNDVLDRERLAKGLRRIATEVASNPRQAEVRLRILAGALPLANRVGEALTTELLRQVGPSLDAAPARELAVAGMQAALLERGLLFAAHFDLPDLVREFSDRLIGLLKSLTDQSGRRPQDRKSLARSVDMDVLGRLVGQTLSSLRKFGLRDQSERMLQQIADTALEGQSFQQAREAGGPDWQPKLRLLLNVAAGWLHLDQPKKAASILEAAREWIRSPDNRAADRPSLQYVPLVCAYIAAAGQAPLDEAVARIEELFTSGRMDRLPNTFTSGPFYSRFHLNVAEAVVLTLATEDFTLGPAARRWLEDDEYLVRRRIHRDVRAALVRAGMS